MEQTLNALSAGLAALVERAAPLAVGVEARNRIGSSGFFWKPGLVVTAEHTVRRDDDIAVILPDGRSTRASLAGRDPGTDIALLRVEDATAAEFERSEPRAGELVVAVGRHQPGVLASLGMVSTAAGAWRTWRGGQVDSLLRLDIGAYPRSSGSAVLDTAGRIAGMLTAGLTRTAPVAVPGATIDRVAAELLAHGRIARGYLGVGLQPVPLPERLAALLNRTQRSGLILLSVEPSGPADQAGFVLGDILVALNGRPVEDTDDVQTALEGKVGVELPAELLRGGERVEVGVRVGERKG